MALISINALFALLLVLTIGTTAAEMADFERLGNQSITAAKLDIAPGSTASTDLNLTYTTLTATAQTQSFTVTNTASPTTLTDIYLWIDPAAGFPFCPAAGLKPLNVTIADFTGAHQTMNLCDLIGDADDNPNIPNGANAPFKIADDVAGGVAVSRDVTMTVDANASPTIWNNANGTAVLTLFGTQGNAPGPVIP